MNLYYDLSQENTFGVLFYSSSEYNSYLNEALFLIPTEETLICEGYIDSLLHQYYSFEVKLSQSAPRSIQNFVCEGDILINLNFPNNNPVIPGEQSTNVAINPKMIKDTHGQRLLLKGALRTITEGKTTAKCSLLYTATQYERCTLQANQQQYMLFLKYPKMREISAQSAVS